MTALKKSPASVALNGDPRPSFSAPATQFSIAKIKELVAKLEVPFHPALIKWKVEVSEDENRGQIMPYADPRAYIDRLNELFTPAGWTQTYTITTSASFERAEDQKTVSRVFVTCDVTIYGIGSHSATGEEWTDNEYAATGADAQAFKRACLSFGLGRYLYSCSAVWVDLDENQRPRERPVLQGWATPEGWRSGLRPALQEDSPSASAPEKKQRPSAKQLELIGQIETMLEPLGRSLYRGILKQIAKVWNPADIRDRERLGRVLESMQSAEQNLGRLEAVRSKIGPDGLATILSSLTLKAVEQIDNSATLEKLVAAAEERAAQVEAT